MAKSKTKKTVSVKRSAGKAGGAAESPAKLPAREIDPMVEFLSQGRDVKADSITYMLRCNAADMSSHGGWAGWPAEGACTAPDWKNNSACGHGLHGWLMGEGDVAASSYYADAESKWLVCAVWAADVVDLGSKVKAPRAWVVFCGAAGEAAKRIQEMGAKGAVIAGTATAGDDGTATAGARGTATAGYAGTATAGDDGTATAGDDGTATAGARGTATAGDDGTATAGDDGIIVLRRWNGKRWKLVVGYIGEDGLEANVPYRLDESGSFVRASK